MTQRHLLRDRHFWPLFYTQFCGAFNDNVFKFALIGLIIAHGDKLNLFGMDSKELQALASGLFILPFFIFSATAGQYADKYDKAKLIQIIKIFEIIVMSLAIIGFLSNEIAYLLVVLFLMGTQSSFFGPVKYSIIPQHISPNKITLANGYVEMGTFLAILIGTILGTYLIESRFGAIIISSTILLIAILGWWFSRSIPQAPSTEPQLKVNYNIFTRTIRQIRYAASNKQILIAILAISWFWYVGAVVLTLIQPLAKEVLNGDLSLRLLFLTCISIGIGAGSIFCGRLAHGKQSKHLIPIGAIGITIFGADIYFSSQELVKIIQSANLTIVDTTSFLSYWPAYRLLMDLFLYGICGGLYIVPLYVILQLQSPQNLRSRNIAVNNIVNALFMVVSAIMIIVLSKANFTVAEILLITAILNFIVCSILIAFMPDVVKSFLQHFIKRLVPNNKSEES